MSYEEEGTVRNFVDTIHEEAKRRALATIKGSSRFLDWQGNHPDHGHPIVGCVVVWSPSTAKAAADAQRGGAAGGVQGYDAKGGTPGVRRSREDEGAPQGAGATGGAGSIGCDGVEAVGVGLDRASAVLAGITGVIAAHYLNTWNARQGSFDVAITTLAFVILGGSRSWLGPVIGGLLLTALPELLRPVGDLRLVLFGLVILLGPVFFPQGLITPALLERLGRGKP